MEIKDNTGGSLIICSEACKIASKHLSAACPSHSSGRAGLRGFFNAFWYSSRSGYQPAEYSSH